MTEDIKPRIMIVDDNSFTRQSLTRFLDEYTIFTAASGEEAVNIAHSKEPDLILLDIILPDMSGYEVIARLKESHITKDIPVIFITGLASVEEETKGLLLGAVDYITKPVHKDIVQVRVRTQLQIIKQLRMVEKLGLIDSLTGLANRRCFDQQMELEWAKAERQQSILSLLMIDIDYFKNYNDLYGHPMGDELLKTMGKILKGSLRRPGDVAARIGGDEFAVLLPDTDMAGFIMVGNAIRGAMEALGLPSGLDPQRPVTVSLGAEAAQPGLQNHHASVAALIASCDKKLYEAKMAGRNRFCY